MKVCRKCGKPAISDTDMFCADCGGDLIEKSEFAEFVANNPEDDNSHGSYTGYTHTENVNYVCDSEPYYSQDDIANNKVYAVLSYISILFLVPMIGAKNSPYAKFHANQGLLLFIVNLIIDFASGFIEYFGILKIATLIFMIMGIVNAAKGKTERLPIFGKFDLYK